MRIIKYIVLLTFLLHSCLNERPKPLENTPKIDSSVKFDSIIAHFRKRNYTEDTLNLPLIHKTRDFSIQISDNPLPLELKEVVLKNPIDNQYPISYSVIFQNRLVSLFEPGVFVCYSIPKLERDVEFEKKLNSMKFQYQWIIDDKLVGISSDKYYALNSDTTWEEYKEQMPISSQPVLYDDDKYIVFSDCHGEWGGTVYFYNKLTHKIHFTEATCATSIQKTDDKYLVFSSLAHMLGSIDVKEILDPDKLPMVVVQNINKTRNGQALGYSDRTKFSKSIFSAYGILGFGSFRFMNRNVYLFRWRHETFLAEVENSTIKIINPLFNKGIFSYDAMTSDYNGTILINIEYDDCEGICFILKDNQFIKLDWNEKHAYY